MGATISRAEATWWNSCCRMQTCMGAHMMFENVENIYVFHAFGRTGMRNPDTQWMLKWFWHYGYLPYPPTKRKMMQAQRTMCCQTGYRWVDSCDANEIFKVANRWTNLSICNVACIPHTGKCPDMRDFQTLAETTQPKYEFDFAKWTIFKSCLLSMI